MAWDENSLDFVARSAERATLAPLAKLVRSTCSKSSVSPISPTWLKGNGNVCLAGYLFPDGLFVLPFMFFVWSLSRIQAAWRGYLVRQWYKKLRESVPPNDPKLRKKFYEDKVNLFPIHTAKSYKCLCNLLIFCLA